MNGAVVQQVRRLYHASGATEKPLIIDDGGFRGTEMYHSGESGAVLRAEILAFIESVYLRDGQG